MSSTQLANTASATLDAVGKTAVTVIDVYRAGGTRLTAGLDQGWDRIIGRTGAILSEQLNQDLVAAQREVTGLVNKGIDLLAHGSSRAVGLVVDFTHARVARLGERASSLEAALAPLPLGSAFLIAKPAVQAANDVAGFVAQRSGQVLSRLRVEPVVKPRPAAAPKAAAARRKTARRG